jgi:hypothetical protein
MPPRLRSPSLLTRLVRQAKAQAAKAQAAKAQAAKAAGITRPIGPVAHSPFGESCIFSICNA